MYHIGTIFPHALRRTSKNHMEKEMEHEMETRIMLGVTSVTSATVNIRVTKGSSSVDIGILFGRSV